MTRPTKELALGCLWKVESGDRLPVGWTLVVQVERLGKYEVSEESYMKGAPTVYEKGAVVALLLQADTPGNSSESGCSKEGEDLRLFAAMSALVDFDRWVDMEGRCLSDPNAGCRLP